MVHRSFWFYILDKERVGESREIFRKVEPLLRQGADIQSKVGELEELNESLRNRDNLKDDAIA